MSKFSSNIWMLNNTIGKLSDLFHKRAFGVDNDKKNFILH